MAEKPASYCLRPILGYVAWFDYLSTNNTKLLNMQHSVSLSVWRHRQILIAGCSGLCIMLHHVGLLGQGSVRPTQGKKKEEKRRRL